ncbi:MAG TPA: hypothetical protein VHT71_27505 [Methylomirabilota bacterium]|jgi:hypothetical protein|nr:hypothetical protein [Methylomirabilota bacterium]
MRVDGITVLITTMLGLGGCAALACAPVTIVVADKEERPTLVSQPRGLRTDELGRVKEERRDSIGHEYWVRNADGHWVRVSEAQWQAAEPGRPLEVCR